MGERQKLENLRVVVKHFFKVRDMPLGVGRIAGKAAAQVIIDAARAQRVEQLAQRQAKARVVAAKKLVVEETKDGRVGEFWRAPNAAVYGIENVEQVFARSVEISGPNSPPASGAARLLR